MKAVVTSCGDHTDHLINSSFGELENEIEMVPAVPTASLREVNCNAEVAFSKEAYSGMCIFKEVFLSLSGSKVEALMSFDTTLNDVNPHDGHFTHAGETENSCLPLFKMEGENVLACCNP